MMSFDALDVLKVLSKSSAKIVSHETARVHNSKWNLRKYLITFLILYHKRFPTQYSPL